MKIYNCIVQYDIYVVAESKEDAMQAALKVIAKEPPNDTATYEVQHIRDIRNDWRIQQPFVAPDISDDDFEPFQGKTTEEVYSALYTKDVSISNEALKP